MSRSAAGQFRSNVLESSGLARSVDRQFTLALIETCTHFAEFSPCQIGFRNSGSSGGEDARFRSHRPFAEGSGVSGPRDRLEPCRGPDLPALRAPVMDEHPVAADRHRRARSAERAGKGGRVERELHIAIPSRTLPRVLSRMIDFSCRRTRLRSPVDSHTRTNIWSRQDFPVCG